MFRLIATIILLIGQVHALGAVTSIRQDLELLSGRYLLFSGCAVDDLCYGSGTTSLIPPNVARRNELSERAATSLAVAMRAAKGKKSVADIALVAEDFRALNDPASTTGKKSVADILDDPRNSTIEFCKPTNRHPERPRYRHAELTRCQDGTYSYQQNEKDFLLGEGICGAVGVANVMVHTMDAVESPRTLFVAFGLDKKGSDADDLKRLLTSMWRKSGQDQSGSYRWDHDQVKTVESLDRLTRPYPEQAKPFLPTIVALRAHLRRPGHWTTVVRVEESQPGDCRVVHNTWGRQYHTDCRIFEKLMANAGGTALYLSKSRPPPSRAAATRVRVSIATTIVSPILPLVGPILPLVGPILPLLQ